MKGFLNFCDFPVNNHKDFCATINCCIHKKKNNIYDENALCSVKVDNDTLCCSKTTENMKCKLHQNSELVEKNTLFTRCHYHFHNPIFDKYPFLNGSDLNNFNTRCTNRTQNKNGLCNYHYSNIICPCSKHSTPKVNFDSDHAILKEALFDPDILFNIIKFSGKNNLNLINCTCKLLYNYNKNNLQKKKSNISEYRKEDIIYFIKNEMYKLYEISDKESKAQIALNIFNYIADNKNFIFNNPRFGIVVLSKLLEFKNDINLDKIPHFHSKCDIYFQKIFNLDSEQVIKLINVIKNPDWPAFTKKGKPCKKCLLNKNKKRCFQHKLI